MHILFCVNKAKLRTKCFVKVEHFVLPFILSVKPALESAKYPPKGPPNKQSVNWAVFTSGDTTQPARLFIADPKAYPSADKSGASYGLELIFS